MKVIISILILSTICIASCKKSKDRGCFKSSGDVTELEVSIDSIQKFRLFKGIVYNFYQDTLRKLVIKGGDNVIGFIDVTQGNYEVSINNLNSCDFLRDYDDKITVDIHYPHYTSIYAEPTEPMRFMDTLTGNQIKIELRNGGESLDLNVDVNRLLLNVSFGAGRINVYGRTGFLKLATQNLGRINALGIKADDMFIYQNSTTDMPVNFDSTNVKVHFKGNGDVRFVGVPNVLEVTGDGDGEVITY
jgi:hypothetical protein